MQSKNRDKRGRLLWLDAVPDVPDDENIKLLLRDCEVLCSPSDFRFCYKRMKYIEGTLARRLQRLRRAYLVRCHRAPEPGHYEMSAMTGVPTWSARASAH